MISKYLPLIFLCSTGAILLDSFHDLPHVTAPSVTPVAAPAQLPPPADATPVPAPSEEAEYVEDVREWLDTLPQKTQSRVRQLMRDAHPELAGLRAAIRDKKSELATLRFNNDTAPETLPRLGMELQVLRDTLSARLQTLRKQISEEAAIDMGRLHKDAFWLPLPPETSLH